MLKAGGWRLRGSVDKRLLRELIAKQVCFTTLDTRKGRLIYIYIYIYLFIYLYIRIYICIYIIDK